MKVAIVGNGYIGSSIGPELRTFENKPPFIHYLYYPRSTKMPFETWLNKFKPRAVFLAIPSNLGDKGKTALKYIWACVKRGIWVITCEKTALAYYAKRLKPYMHLIKFNAALGGGTMGASYFARRHIKPEDSGLEGVFNTTINYILDRRDKIGCSFAESYADAQAQGYAEPNEKGIIGGVINELLDVDYKACIAFNMLFAKKIFITPDMLGPCTFTAQDMIKLGKNYRLVVSIARKWHVFDENVCEPFKQLQVDGWNISIAFRPISTYEFATWFPREIDNAFRIKDGPHYYTVIGPGASRIPTVSALIGDFIELWETNKK